MGILSLKNQDSSVLSILGVLCESFPWKIITISCDPRDGGFPGVNMVDAKHEVGGGVGRGGVGMITFVALAHMVGATQHHVSCTCTHGRCYENIMFLALAHMVGATQHHVSCTCTHGRCYATSWGGVGMITFLALAHMVGATQHHVPCTCTHGRCYATSFLALAHMVGAMQHHGVGWVGVGWDGDENVHFTCTHGRCYGNVTHVLQEKADCHVVGAPDSL